MQKDESKLSMWVVVAAVLCCGIPLLLLVGAGSVFAFGASFLTNNIILLILGLVFAFVFIWLFIKRRGSE